MPWPWNVPLEEPMNEEILKLVQDMDKKIDHISTLVEANAKWAREGYERHQESLEKHEGTLYGNGRDGLTTEIKAISGIRDDLKGHAVADRWMFGILIVMELGIFVKMFMR